MNTNMQCEPTLNELESPEDAADRHFADWESQEAENNSEKKEESK